MREIAKTGLQEILILTGEQEQVYQMEYIGEGLPDCP